MSLCVLSLCLCPCLCQSACLFLSLSHTHTYTHTHTDTHTHTLTYMYFGRPTLKVTLVSIPFTKLLNEIGQVGFRHYPHSFVLGNWQKEDESSNALLSICCHDVDLIAHWMSGQKCVRIASFGHLSHFRKEDKVDVPFCTGVQGFLECVRNLAQSVLTLGSFWHRDILFGYFLALIDFLMRVQSLWFLFRVRFRDKKTLRWSGVFFFLGFASRFMELAKYCRAFM